MQTHIVSGAFPPFPVTGTREGTHPLTLLPHPVTDLTDTMYTQAERSAIDPRDRQAVRVGGTGERQKDKRTWNWILGEFQVRTCRSAHTPALCRPGRTRVVHLREKGFRDMSAEFDHGCRMHSASGSVVVPGKRGEEFPFSASGILFCESTAGSKCVCDPETYACVLFVLSSCLIILVCP